jgi:hypothetical protein
MIVEVSAEAAVFVRERGSSLWVWAAYPRLCCAGSPAWMHAGVSPPAGLTGFRLLGPPADTAGLQLFFKGLAGRQPQTLQVALHGRRRPAVEAYWDGCLMAMA